MKSLPLEQAAIAALQERLAGIPFLQIAGVERTGAFLQVWLRVQELPYRLEACVMNNGQPRFARLAAYELQKRLSNMTDVYGLFIAPYISTASAKILAESGIGHLDLAGNCLLSFKTVYVRQSGAPNPQIKKRLQRSLYSPKSERILRALLSEPRRFWKMQELAQTASVSLGQVSNIKKLLVDREWLDISDKGFSLKCPGDLLDDWIQTYNYRRSPFHEFYTLSEPAAAEADLASACECLGARYTLTGLSGAIRIAPMVRYDRVMAYVQGDLALLAAKAGLKPVDSGANVILLTPYDEGVFYASSAIGGIVTASPLQVYLDVVGLRGRGQEAAVAIRQKMEAAW